MKKKLAFPTVASLLSAQKILNLSKRWENLQTNLRQIS